MSIGDLVRRMVDEREPRNPDGGIAGLTDEELKPWTDLLNAPGSVCECGDAGCCSPVPRNPDRKPGV